MALSPRLELRQSQSLVMTPQLQQAIKLLQFSNIELSAYIEDELERNPLLMHEDQEQHQDDERRTIDDPQEAPAAPNDDLSTMNLETSNPDVAENALDAEVDNVWSTDTPGDAGSGLAGDAAFATWSGSSGGFDDMDANLEQTFSGAESLRDHVLAQIGIELADPVDRMIATHLTDRLDEAGYVSGDFSDIATLLGCDPDRVALTLQRIQHFDPPGIFARNLAECLAIQLRERNRLDPAMQALLDNLDLLARRDTQALLKVCGIDAEDLSDMVAEIRALTPKPAQAFDHEAAQPVTPDVIMRAQPGGGWAIELNNETLPRVLVNNRYFSTVSTSARTRDEKSYINECLQSANWLVKSLHQRATTILKVAGEIVLQQDAFFAHGVEHLRPLVLRDIAQAIEMHESTVSRVTSNKFIATPRGIFELKYFFTTAIASASGGDAHSAEAVRHRIKTLIDDEAAQKVLSDDKLVDILKGEGIDIARRTVAKYRESLGIPSSVQRRRQKKSGY